MDKKKPNQPRQPLGTAPTHPNLARLYLLTLSPTGADLALLICLEAALWIS